MCERPESRSDTPSYRLSDVTFHTVFSVFKGFYTRCPLVLARREKGIKRMKEIRLVRRRSRRQASRSSVIYTSQRVNVRAFFIPPLLPAPHAPHVPLTPTVGHPRHFRFLDDCAVTFVPARLLFERVGARPCSGPRKSRNLSPVRHNDLATALIIAHPPKTAVRSIATKISQGPDSFVSMSID